MNGHRWPHNNNNKWNYIDIELSFYGKLPLLQMVEHIADDDDDGTHHLLSADQKKRKNKYSHNGHE